MKRFLYMICLCLTTLSAQAQKLTRDYRNQSLSAVLEDLNKAAAGKTLYFIYDELEDFTVTSHFSNLTLEDALREVIGFYPIKVTFDIDKVFVECTQKEDVRVIGRVVDERGQPIEFANITLLSDTIAAAGGTHSSYINGGVSNENGDFVIPCSSALAGNGRGVDGQVMVKVSYVGYKTVSRQVKTGRIGTITLTPETYTVQGVTIKGEIPQYRMVQGGLTVDVQHSILRDIGTADDLLSMLPLVQGRDGKFEVLSKGEPEVYINNKKVRDAGELKRLKSVDVKSVDVITAPGAQYNAEVNAVIRIKTLKTEGDGLSVMATSQTWKNNKWNNYDDLIVKYRTGGLEAFATVALDNGHYSADEDVCQELHITKDLFNPNRSLEQCESK